MFTQAEAQYILQALDLQTKTTGLATAGMALQIVAKLQAGLAAQEATPAVQEPQEEPEAVEKNSQEEG